MAAAARAGAGALGVWGGPARGVTARHAPGYVGVENYLPAGGVEIESDM